MKKSFSNQLLAWYDQQGRKDLPWQQGRTPYRTWISEIMLQQTQVMTVIPYFCRFMDRFPDIRALAAAPLDDVMSVWAGLGYYARARNLHRCARMVLQKYRGQFPGDLDELMALPGIGRSTAGAIVAQAFDRRAVILDGNVKRVLTRQRVIKGWPGKSSVQNLLWAIAEEFTPEKRCADYTQAIMDLGALVCTRSVPHCLQCPVSGSCQAFQQSNPEAYPEKRETRKRSTQEITVLLCYQQGKSVMLERRPPAGIWGGLWSLPQCGTHEDPAEFLKTGYGYEIQTMCTEPTSLHILTHLRLHINPIWAQVTRVENAIAEADQKWCTLSDIAQMGMPQPIEKLVAHFFQSVNRVAV